MINTLLSKIAGFFEKDFLFASFLPSLIFLPCIAITLAVVIGIDAVWTLIESCTTMQKTAISASCTLGLVVFAYVLNALRPFFIRFWSGELNCLYLLWGLWRFLEFIQKLQFLKMRKRANKLSPWLKVLESFEDGVRRNWEVGRDDLPESESSKLIKKVNILHIGMKPEEVKEKLQIVIDAYNKYSGNSLGDIYETIKRMLMDWNNEEKVRIQTDTYNLDRQFGTLETLRATALGNIIESYRQYPFKRYKMEAEIFWPRLLLVIKPEYLTLVQEPRILLDFSLTMASLGAIYSFMALLIGPWLWFNLWFWIPQAIVGLIFCIFFYRLGVSAAFQYGEMVRSSFDLFRLDLMANLNRPRPSTFNVEQNQWEELSKLAAYGEKIDFKISEGKTQ